MFRIFYYIETGSLALWTQKVPRIARHLLRYTFIPSE